MNSAMSLICSVPSFLVRSCSPATTMNLKYSDYKQNAKDYALNTSKELHSHKLHFTQIIFLFIWVSFLLLLHSCQPWTIKIAIRHQICLFSDLLLRIETSTSILFHSFLLFSRDTATLYERVSVRPSVH